ncbi:hypothetical protein PACTADRAFT_50794 [Pachysolen tannophilus NRRL Y-2460]|uniref:Methyltransferase type 11 domain-containing protein n=1 Tax=Pachysolen tannophilus NRRL Y-2460 TaxID=669874 RepID=A0A1E4TT80_PACTA|nr:hypothetical protein PACTADRAFT_50794 [Pachysolen tannophilus NRRL Y-2460]
MSQFSSQSFKSENYGLYRPNYPPSFFNNLIKNYHNGNDFRTALDIGCGPGEATFPLARLLHFDKVIGIDPSLRMVEAAQKSIPTEYADKIIFKQSRAESISFISNNSIDLITSAQAAHWFDHDVWFKEMARILKDNGSLIYFGYADPIIQSVDGDPSDIKGDFAKANELLLTYFYNSKYLGNYWEQPGRSIIRNLNKDIDAKIPKDLYYDFKSGRYDPIGEDKTPINDLYIWKKNLKLQDFINYFSTFSSVHKWHESHNNVLKGSKDDIVVKFTDEFKSRFGWNLDKKINVIWKSCYTMIRRIPRK